MAFVYAMSDIYGKLEAFHKAFSLIDLSGNNQLILCGDYVHGGEDSYGVLEKVMELMKRQENGGVGEWMNTC